jgi:hypothetical protein
MLDLDNHIARLELPGGADGHPSAGTGRKHTVCPERAI